MVEQQVIDVIIVTEQLAQADFIGRAFKQYDGVNIHQSNQLGEIKTMLGSYDVALIIVDDADGTLDVSSVYASVVALQLQTPILQLVSTDNEQSFGRLMQAGASIVCPKDDAIAIATNVKLLLSYSENQNKLARNSPLAYVLIGNYRDVWGTDGFVEAEKLIAATLSFIRQYTSPNTDISRYTDDGILLFIPDLGEKTADETLRKLVRGLDSVTPENMARMVEPICYVGFGLIDKDTDYSLLISQLFKTAHRALVSGGTRVAMPSAIAVAPKDKKRLTVIQNALSEKCIHLTYQPIVSFSADGLRRYADYTTLLDEENNALDMELMLAVAERYQLTHRLDKSKITQILDKLLEMSRDERRGLLIFITISMDSLKSVQFTSWLVEQMQHTGLGGEHFVFELMTDNILNAYSGAKTFTDEVRKYGAKIAIGRISNLSKENNRIIDEIKPDVIKLDMREIDTLDELEEKETMEDILEKNKTCQAMLMAENIESPAQLARIWGYDIRVAQGRGLASPSAEMDFDFAEFHLQ